MKTLSVLTLAMVATPCLTQTATASVRGSIFLLDDQSGPELETLHGINPIQISDMEVLLNGVVQGKRAVRLFHQVVDEDSTDNEILELEFRPFEGGQPPKAPADNLPLRELETAAEEYLKQRSIWNAKMKAYRTELKGQAEGFIRKIAANQAAVAERFDLLLAARNGADFNRSDIVTCILAANRALGVEGSRILVVNSDAVDLAANRKPRKTPMTPTELSPDVVIIFVNQSKIPQASPLFSGLSNQTFHANTIKEAMLLALSLLNGTAQEEKKLL